MVFLEANINLSVFTSSKVLIKRKVIAKFWFSVSSRSRDTHEIHTTKVVSRHEFVAKKL